MFWIFLFLSILLILTLLIFVQSGYESLWQDYLAYKRGEIEPSPRMKKTFKKLKFED